MTDKQHPEAFCWATELAMVCKPVTLTVKEAREVSDEMQRMHAENETLTLYKNMADEYGLSIFPDIAEMTAELETLRAKLKTYEDLGGAGSDVQLLRMGYAAARLEIESLRARSAEPAGEYPVLPAPDFGRARRLGAAYYGDAYTADQMRAYGEACWKAGYKHGAWADTKPAGAQQPGAAYAALPECSAFLLCNGSDVTARAWNVDQMRAFADATHAMRASHGQAPAQAAPAAVAGPSWDAIRVVQVQYAGIVKAAVGLLAAVDDRHDSGSPLKYTIPYGAVNALRDALTAAPTTQPAPASQGDALDAARWRALLACGRIRIIGTAGVTGTGVHDPNALDPHKKPYGNYVHFGAEFWSVFPDQGYYNTKENPAYARATLTEFADAARAAQEGK